MLTGPVNLWTKVVFALRCGLVYTANMRQYRSHREIIERWKEVPVQGRASFFYVLARDLRDVLPVTVSYYTVRRWWERDNIPIEYHDGVIEVAKRRGFDGITNGVLAGIKARELSERVAASAA